MSTTVATLHGGVGVLTREDAAPSIGTWDAASLISIPRVVYLRSPLSDVINNAAAAILMVPIAVGIASTLGASVDPFLNGRRGGCLLRLSHTL